MTLHRDSKLCPLLSKLFAKNLIFERLVRMGHAIADTASGDTSATSGVNPQLARYEWVSL
jgi:hypothetical protein